MKLEVLSSADGSNKQPLLMGPAGAGLDLSSGLAGTPGEPGTESQFAP